MAASVLQWQNLIVITEQSQNIDSLILDKKSWVMPPWTIHGSPMKHRFIPPGKIFYFSCLYFFFCFFCLVYPIFSFLSSIILSHIFHPFKLFLSPLNSHNLELKYIFKIIYQMKF